jgi:hypothetical protein
MLYRNSEGKLVEININDYLTDKEYYKKIIDINHINDINNINHK